MECEGGRPGGWPPGPHLGVLAGMQSEARAVLRFRSGALPLSVALSGARLAGAEGALQQLKIAGVTHLMSYGLAGGLDPALKPGQLLLPRELVTSDGARYPVARNWHYRVAHALRDLKPRTGLQLGSDIALADATAKAAAFTRFGADAVDMESQIVARSGLPFIILRVIADDATTSLPKAALVGIKANGAPNLPAILAQLIRRPADLPALARLGRAAASAEKTLLRCGHAGLFSNSRLFMG